MASSNINEKVQEALKEGHSWEDIQAHLSSSRNPEAQSYLAGLQAAQTQRTGATPQSVTTQALDYVQENPKEALGYGALAYGALQAPKIASKVADYRLKQRELDLKERSLATYAAQVAKQGAVPELLNPQDDLINSVRPVSYTHLTLPTSP
jgi:hypothetical protein